MKSKITRHKVKSSHMNGQSGTASGIQVRKSVTIDRPAEELYAFWRDFRHHARFMTHVEAVEILDERRSRWHVKGPAGKTIDFEALLVEDRPSELLSWRSTEEADVENSGAVLFQPAAGHRGTTVTVVIIYNPPGGIIGDWFAMLFGEEPSQQLSQDLRRFKALMETGEIPTNELRRAAEPALAGR